MGVLNTSTGHWQGLGGFGASGQEPDPECGIPMSRETGSIEAVHKHHNHVSSSQSMFSRVSQAISCYM